ncbi:hypothetical protein [Streptomyces sp. NPDC042319]|uniref:hypothetical protein n=1 Tax=Streptomyces sp. NPDC042319 TaxID=3154332 RepID=UPI0033FB4C72
MFSETLLRLPGPRRHLAHLQEDLRDGTGCLWLFPEPEVDSGRAEQFLGALLSGLDDVIEVPGASDATASGRPPHDAQADIWGYEDGSYAGLGGFGEGFDYDDGFGDWGRGEAAPVPVPTPAATPPEFGLSERLAKELGLTADPVEALVEGAQQRGPVLVIRAWNEDDPGALSRLLRRMQAAVKDAGLPPALRPRLLVAARLEDLARDAWESLDPVLYRAHWWWSVWSRLDTITLVTETYGVARPTQSWNTAQKRILQSVRCETLAEVCGPDLPLVTQLAHLWDGKPGTLLTALMACRRATGSSVKFSGNTSAAYAPAPEPSVRPAWASGLLDSWEGQVRCTPVEWAMEPDGPERLDKLVWQAQNRVLLPLIDDARVRFVALLPQGAVRGVRHLVETYVDRTAREGRATAADLASMELGAIWAAVKRRDVSVSGTQQNQLAALRTARNKLAHRCPLDDETLRKLVDALTS